MFQQPFYPRQQQGFQTLRYPPNFFLPSQPFLYRSNGSVSNRSTHNFNFTRDFERAHMPHHGFNSVPSSSYPLFDVSNQNLEQQRWRQHMARVQQQQQKHRRTPAFHFQDNCASYYMTDPIKKSDGRLTIQLTKVHTGPTGDQQRVFVEQDFTNEKELNTFVRNFRQNFEKAFNNCPPTAPGSHEHTDEPKTTDRQKSGVVVVEEPDEEPKIYQQQVYNANIESRKAAAAAAAARSIITPPMSPDMRSPSPAPNPTPSEDHSGQYSRAPSHERHWRTGNRTKYVSPPASHLSTSSAALSYRRQRNKMKYRRQQKDHAVNREGKRKDDEENCHQRTKASRIFQMPSMTRHYPAAGTAPRFHPRLFTAADNPAFQWRFNPTIHGYPKTHSRAHFPSSMTDAPAASAPRFHNPMDPFFRPIDPARFAPNPYARDFRTAPSPFRFSHFQGPKHQAATTVTDNLRFSNQEEQQPRVHRAKSECETAHSKQQHRSRSATHPFQQFSPIRHPPTVQRHFTPFRSAPFVAPAPIFHGNQRRPFGSAQQVPLHLLNSYRLGLHRF